MSFGVCSLFTNPLDETINLAVDRLFVNLKATRKELRELFEFCTSQTNFISKGVIYDQINAASVVFVLLLVVVVSSNWLLLCLQGRSEWCE